MAQHDMNIANQGFPATRADLNNALQALVSNSSGTSEPSTTFANQWWYDTTNNKLYIRNEANNAWIEVAVLDQTNNEWQISTGVVQAKDSDGLALKTDDGTTRLFVKDSDGFIGIGTTSPDTQLTVESDATTQLKLINDNADNNGARITLFKNSSSPADDDTIGLIDFNANDSAGSGKVFARISVLADDVTAATTDSVITYSTRRQGTLAERARFNPSGDFVIGQENPQQDFGEGRSTIALKGTDSADYSTLQLGNYGTTNSSQAYGTIAFFDGTNRNAQISSLRGSNATSGGIHFYTAVTGTLGERGGFDEQGNFYYGGSVDATVTNGTGGYLGENGQAYFSTSSSSGHFFNVQSDNQTIVVFRQGGTTEGSISVSGTTVSYNGGHLARLSRLSDNSKDTSIVKGTVMTNLNTMVVWDHDAVAATYYQEGDDLPQLEDKTFYQEGDTIPDGKKIGDVKTEAVFAQVGDLKTEAVDAYTEDNEQLNHMAVSSVEGDVNVAGVFVNWDESDDFNDMNVAMTGDMVIRIAQGATVAQGDLLMSAGDGTAKPQGDDIVRSKTIAKVTSTTVSHTYDDGSYCVPCVLMAC